MFTHNNKDTKAMSKVVLVFLLLTLNNKQNFSFFIDYCFTTFSSVSIIDFEQTNVCWQVLYFTIIQINIMMAENPGSITSVSIVSLMTRLSRKTSF